jgi:hypothetical protein
MLTNLALGLLTMVFCLFMQAVLLVASLRYYRRRSALINNSLFWSSVMVVKGVMLMLVAGNLLQIAVWAWLFAWVEEFANFSDAFYHSAVNFATLGYGDLVMSQRHRLLGPLEAINGALMIGVSTAVLMAALQDALRKTLVARSND